MSRRMFAGELEGELVLLYMGFRADEVRQSISELFFVRGEGPQSAPDCVFEQTCLRELAEFIEVRTREQRAGI